MPRNDRSDSLSVRGDDDPRRPLKAMQQEAELEFGWSQSHDSGGVEHQGQDDRAGRAPERSEPKEGGPSRSAGTPPDREPDDAPLAPSKREESED
jgi:hypothetical protein